MKYYDEKTFEPKPIGWAVKYMKYSRHVGGVKWIEGHFTRKPKVGGIYMHIYTESFAGEN